MDQSFYTSSNLDKCTIIGNYHYTAFNFITNLDVFIQRIPRMRGKLFETEGDTFLIFIKVENNHFNFLIKLNNFFRMIDASP